MPTHSELAAENRQLRSALESANRRASEAEAREARIPGYEKLTREAEDLCERETARADAAEAREAVLREAIRIGREAIGVMVESIIECFVKISDSEIDRDLATKVLARVRVAKPIMDTALATPSPVAAALVELERAAGEVERCCIESYEYKRKPPDNDDEYDAMMRPLWSALDNAIAALDRARGGK